LPQPGFTRTERLKLLQELTKQNPQLRIIQAQGQGTATTLFNGQPLQRIITMPKHCQTEKRNQPLNNPKTQKSPITERLKNISHSRELPTAAHAASCSDANLWM